MPTYLERYQIFESLKDRYPITWLTKMAKVQRSGYYKCLKNRKVSLRKIDDAILKEHTFKKSISHIKCMASLA